MEIRILRGLVIMHRNIRQFLFTNCTEDEIMIQKSDYIIRRIFLSLFFIIIMFQNDK
jgi:hypothetical protein